MIRHSYRSFLGETLEYRESQQIPPEILDGMVTRLREGDRSMIDPIIKGHYRLVTSLVSRNLRKKGKSADIEGAAFLCLVESVHACCPHTDEYGEYQESRLYDNNITAYITVNVNYAIKDEYGSDHILRVPPRTIRHKIAKGENFEDLIPDDPMEIAGDYESNDAKLGMALPFLIPLAKPEFPSLEFNEALAKSVVGETEKAIVRLRTENYTYEEIGPKIGYSFNRVCQFMRDIESRFNRFYP